MRNRISLAVIIGLLLTLTACDYKQTSNDVQRDQQNKLLDEATAQTGMPAIKNFRERKLLKDILELRDQTGLVTYTYTYSEMTGKKQFFCNSVGYGIPYATQYTAPETIQTYNLPTTGGSEHHYGSQRLPQADPNGLFSPASAEGTWIMCKDPNGTEAKPIYVEPRVIVSPFKLPE